MTGNLRYGALGSEISSENNQVTVFFDRVAKGSYDFLIRRVIFNMFKVFSERFARYSQTVPL